MFSCNLFSPLREKEQVSSRIEAQNCATIRMNEIEEGVKFPARLVKLKSRRLSSAAVFGAAISTMCACKGAVNPEKSDSTENWTVVLRPRRRNGVKLCSIVPPKEEEAWEPLDQECDPARESKLMQRIQVCVQNFEKSESCRAFLNEIQTPNFLDKIMRVLGSEKKLRMVIYGIGSIESISKNSRLQLSLALVMKKKLDWIGDIEVFDPIISLTELKVLKSLGCYVLSVNDQCRRKALEPILFFMPHCELFMYENLLEANWTVDLLKRCVVFGNSFSEYKQQCTVDKNFHFDRSRKHILAATSFTQEMTLDCFSDDSFGAFKFLSWHIFTPTKLDS